ncbi:MAG: lysozyme [Luteolibacter sp.]
MIYLEKDPTLKTLLIQQCLATHGLYTGAVDNWYGPRTEDARAAFAASFIAPPPPPGDLPNLHRDISADGVAIIQEFEGLFLNAYQDGGGVWTIGWGHTGLKHQDGTVYKGRKITIQQAKDLFSYDMDFFEGRVQKFITIDLNDDEFAALVSFDFNTGALGDSTLRRYLNAGNRLAAADQFLRYEYDNGKKVPGLLRRRKSERNLFLGLRPFIVPV